jgi:SulP family sulfate permease
MNRDAGQIRMAHIVNAGSTPLVETAGKPGRTGPALPFGLGYSGEKFRRDLVAALTVAAISLPQAMAYALLAGVDPRFGLYSAIVVTAVASVFGSSSHLINGPTSAISLVVFSALAYFDPGHRADAAEGMFVLGAMVGLIQIAIGVFRLGDLTRYISESVIVGFMSAAAVLLAVGQIANALGVHEKGTGDQHVLVRLWRTLTEGDPINLKAVAIAVATLALALILRKLVRRFRLPQMDMLVALIVIALAAWLAGWTVAGSDGKTTIAIAGTVPASLPGLHLPEFRLTWIKGLAPDALAIAFLGLLEALAIAKSIANETRQTLDYNRQCLAEGIANLTGSFFRCLPGSGSLSRSAINFQAGGATRASGVMAAATVAVAVLLLAPLAQFVPKPALAALLLLTATRLIDLKRLAYTIRASRNDAGVVAATVLSGLAFGLDMAILVGVGLSILLFVPRAARLKAAELFVDPGGVVRERQSEDPAPDVFILYDLEGELFFGAAPDLDRCLSRIARRAEDEGLRYVVLRMKRVRNPDVVCLEHLERFLRHCDKIGVTVLLAGVGPDLLDAFGRLGFGEWLPPDRIFKQRPENYSGTLAAIRSVYDRLGKVATPAQGDSRAGLPPPPGLTYQI